MKARIKATGQIFELCPYVYDIDGNDFHLEEIELLDNPNWQHYRIQAAIAAMQAFIGVPQTPFGHIAKEAVKIADALIEELKKGAKE